LKTRFSAGRWLRVTGKIILVAVPVTLLILFLTRGYWLRAIGQDLACTESNAAADAMIIENFDPAYLLFERAAALQAERPTRVLVHVRAMREDPTGINPISRGIAELMARQARLGKIELIPVKEAEPYALTVAYQIRDFLAREHVRSVVVVSPDFRSKRTSLVYEAVLGPAGIQSHCIPVFGNHTPENWTSTWHGMQVVIEQFLKLQFYRFHVLRGGIDKD
jgi:hypothetical protein